jgi:hypothetical protein
LILLAIQITLAPTVAKVLTFISCQLQAELELIVSPALFFQTASNAAQETLTNVPCVPTVTISTKIQIVLHALQSVQVVSAA